MTHEVFGDLTRDDFLRLAMATVALMHGAKKRSYAKDFVGKGKRVEIIINVFDVPRKEQLEKSDEK